MSGNPTHDEIIAPDPQPVPTPVGLIGSVLVVGIMVVYATVMLTQNNLVPIALLGAFAYIFLIR